MDEIEQDLRGLRPAFLLAQLAGLTMVVTMSVWTGHYLGGFAGQTVPELNFNWHPLLLTISLIYLYGNGILIYRLARQERKQRLKVAHATGEAVRPAGEPVLCCSDGLLHPAVLGGGEGGLGQPQPRHAPHPPHLLPPLLVRHPHTRSSATAGTLLNICAWQSQGLGHSLDG